MAHFHTIALCLALLCAGALGGGSGGGRWAKGSLKSSSRSDGGGTYGRVWTEGETEGEASVLTSGKAKAENYDGISVAKLGLAVLSGRGGRAHGRGDAEAETNDYYGSRVRSGVAGAAFRDGAVYGAGDAAAANRDGFSSGRTDLAVTSFGGDAFGRVKGGSRGGRLAAKSRLEADAETHGDGNVRVGTEFGSDGGRGLLHDRVAGDLVVDSGRKPKKSGY